MTTKEQFDILLVVPLEGVSLSPEWCRGKPDQPLAREELVCARNDDDAAQRIAKGVRSVAQVPQGDRSVLPRIIALWSVNSGALVETLVTRALDPTWEFL